MWSIGTLFGKTIEVDMPFTRQHGVVWIRVGCMDYTRIPGSKHIFIKDGFYELFFELEDGPRRIIDADMQEANGNGDDPHDDGAGNNNGGNGEFGDAVQQNFAIEQANVGANQGGAPQPEVVAPMNNASFKPGIYFSLQLKATMQKSKRD
jgi:hypothetical protein